MSTIRFRTALLAALVSLVPGGCMQMAQDGRNTLPTTTSLAYFPKKTQTQSLLEQLPRPQRQVAVAVYGFTDQTGQFKPSEQGQTLSRAVTQGAGSMLVKALQDAGNRNWFTVVERERLDNLLKERQIIGEMRRRYLGEEDMAGAAFLGIGARTEYRQDTVTVYLRAVSVRTGEVLTTVNASKTIASQAIGASTFRFVAFRQLLEAEAGITSNEPDQVALQQAIEKAVLGLILEGVEASDVQKAVKRAGSLGELTIVDTDKGKNKDKGDKKRGGS